MAASTSRSEVQLSAAEIPSKIDLLISLHLHMWQALTITIQNGWGTSNPQIGEDKRDWLAGAISDLFAQNQLRDLEDLEDVLEQVMNDEFEVVVDDGSLEEVSRKIWRGVEAIKKGDGSEVGSLMAQWQEKQKKGKQNITIVRGDQSDEDESSEDEGEHEWNGFQDAPSGDVDMDEAPALVESKKNIEPIVDEDGFTTVVSRKKR